LLTCLLVGAGYLLFLEPTWGIIESLRTMGKLWEFNGGIFAVVYYFCNSNETAHLISAGMIFVFIVILTFLDRPLIEKVFWAFAGLFLLSPVVHPWYLTWLAALLVLRWSTAIFAFLGLSLLANIVVYQFRAGAGWSDQPLLLAIEYVPVFILLVREVMKGEVLSSRAVESVPFTRQIAAQVKDYEDFT
jgi:drug/metabolite transporter superfamily protein YnfA